VTVDRAQLGEFFRINNIRFGKCLEPHMQCAQPAIRAHSIQNRQTIALLAENDHVMAWQPRFSEGGPDIALRRIGRNEASTFTGFCSLHDSSLFRPLDMKPLDVDDQEQLFLLAYRAITCELHSVTLGVVHVQNIYKSRVEHGLDAPDESSPAGQKAVEQMLLSWATWRYREKYFDQPLLAGNYGGVVHDVIVLENQPAYLAVSSFVALKDIDLADDLVGTAINILPVSATRTVVVFSYASQDRGAAHAVLDRILKATEDYQKYELSKLILSRISNVLISPRHCGAWSPEKTRKITDAFLASVQSQRDVNDDSDLMLF
jgi:hypothetical protein